MYNTDLPTRAELPTSQQLKRSTIIAAISALLILVTIVLPSEYAIDPTGIGRTLGLTEMGEIKTQLAAEAAADAVADAAPARSYQQAATPQSQATPQPESRSTASLNGATAITQPSAPATSLAQNSLTPGNTSGTTTPSQRKRNDVMSINLKPGEGAEVKLVMVAGAKANFSWTANGAAINFDTHGDGGGRSISYEKGRGVADDEGILEAAFDGNHGWFWRNRTQNDVTVTLRTDGDYVELKRVI